MPTREEAEIALKDSVSDALRRIGANLDEFNNKARALSKVSLAGGGGAGGMEGVADETVRLEQKAARANRALGTGGSFASSGALATVLLSFSKILGPPALLAGAFIAAAKSLENFATSRTQLQSFATDVNLTATNVQELRQALSMLSRTGGEQDSIIARLSSRFQDLQTFGTSREAGKLQSVFAQAPGGTEMMKEWKRLLDENPGNFMPALIDMLQKFRQASEGGKNVFAMAFDQDKSLLGELLDALGEVVPEARIDAERMRAHLLRMIKLRGEWDAIWMRVKMFAVDAGVEIGTELEKAGFSMEGLDKKVRSTVDNLNYKEIADILIAIGKDLDKAGEEVAYIMDSESPIIKWIKTNAPIKISILTPEEQKFLEETDMTEKLRINKDSASNLWEAGVKLFQMWSGITPNPVAGFGGIGVRGPSTVSHFRRGVQVGGAGRPGKWWTPERIKYGIERLMKAGYPEVSARAMIARWAAVEAGAGPTAENFVGGGHRGFAQWSTARQIAGGGLPTDEEGQYNFAIRELERSERRARELLMSAKTEEEAAEAVAAYERAEGWNGRRDAFVGKTLDAMRRIKESGSVQGGIGGPSVGQGGGIPEVVAKKAKEIALLGPGPLAKFMRDSGYPQSSQWCGEYAAAVVTAAGGSPPRGYRIASNWRNWGFKSATPVIGGVAIRKRSRYGGGISPTGATGSHVTIPVSIDESTGTFVGSGGNQGSRLQTFNIDDFDFRSGIEAEQAIDQRLQEEARARRGPNVKAEINFRNVPAGVKTSASIEGKGDGIKGLTQTRSNSFSEYMPADL